MKAPKVKTKVAHSETKPAWNIIGTTMGGKFKIARVPYLVTDDDFINAKEKKEAYEHAQFISMCFNNSSDILSARCLNISD